MPTPDAFLQRPAPALGPGARALLEPLLRLGELSEEDGVVTCTVPGEHGAPVALRFLPPLDRIDERAPEVLRRLGAVLGGAEVGTVGDADQLVLHDGFAGTLGCVGEDAWNRRFPFPWSASLCAPVDLGLQAFYVVDPWSGRLLFRDEGPLQQVVGTDDPLEVWLREMHLRLRDLGQPETPIQVAVRALPDRPEWLAPLDR